MCSWPGDAAVPLIESGRCTISQEQKAFLRRHSTSEALNALLDA
jgi:hypothetical protein